MLGEDGGYGTLESRPGGRLCQVVTLGRAALPLRLRPLPLLEHAVIPLPHRARSGGIVVPLLVLQSPTNVNIRSGAVLYHVSDELRDSLR